MELLISGTPVDQAILDDLKSTEEEIRDSNPFNACDKVVRLPDLSADDRRLAVGDPVAFMAKLKQQPDGAETSVS